MVRFPIVAWSSVLLVVTVGSRPVRAAPGSLGALRVALALLQDPEPEGAGEPEPAEQDSEARDDGAQAEESPRSTDEQAASESSDNGGGTVSAAPAEDARAEETSANEQPAAPPAPAPARAAQPSEDRQDTTRYKVVVNHQEQYSIWPEARENALGWRDAGKSGTKEECLAYIKEVWTDMRPLSLRKKMQEQAQP